MAKINCIKLTNVYILAEKCLSPEFSKIFLPKISSSRETKYYQKALFHRADQNTAK